MLSYWNADLPMGAWALILVAFVPLSRGYSEAREEDEHELLERV